MTGATTALLQLHLDRLRQGDASARDELLRHSQERLRVLARRMLSRFPNVHRWEDTDDVLQRLLQRIDHMLQKMEFATVQDFLRLAATNLRRILIDLARHYGGPRGLGANLATPLPQAPGETGMARDPPGETTSDPAVLARWSDFHEQVEQLPEEERAIVDLLWYHGFSQEQAAELLGVSLSTVKRRWQAARLRLMAAFQGESPF